MNRLINLFYGRNNPIIMSSQVFIFVCCDRLLAYVYVYIIFVMFAAHAKNVKTSEEDYCMGDCGPDLSLCKLECTNHGFRQGGHCVLKDPGSKVYQCCCMPD